MGGTTRYSLYQLAVGCTQLSLAQCFCHPEVPRLTVLAQQQIFFLLVDKDLITPKHPYFIDDARPSKLIFLLFSSLSMPHPHDLPEASAGGIAATVVAPAKNGSRGSSISPMVGFGKLQLYSREMSNVLTQATEYSQ